MRFRRRFLLQGTVQGVGFRPFVYQLAQKWDLSGWVQNNAQGLLIEVEGDQKKLDSFFTQLFEQKPDHAMITEHSQQTIPTEGSNQFKIFESDWLGEKRAMVLPDLAPCRECLNEIFNPKNRRYHYPFTNCTHCGPRFSLIEKIPYDRSHTTMRHFSMCAACATEYADPANRRFHAQPNACPNCGPQLELWDNTETVLAKKEGALICAVEAIQEGKIVAVKGVGGFQLLVDARNADAVARLRQRKNRPRKPLAVMFQNRDEAARYCFINEEEKRLLTSAAAPIVLVKKREENKISDAVSPNNPYLGAMLPSSPLHALLLQQLAIPIVATSGNLSEEPIVTDEKEAVTRLKKIADLFLAHNRPIARPLDDSVVQIVAGKEMVLRRARGYAPTPIALSKKCATTLAFGGHLKSSCTLIHHDQLILSQHIGDLSNTVAIDAYQKALIDLPQLFSATPTRFACDKHPDYFSTEQAQRQTEAPLQVQHHYAHLLSCMAEHHLNEKVLGATWDGTGYGDDKTIWGGEFLIADLVSFERFAHLRPFPLPGGDPAAREPRRALLGLLFPLLGEKSFDFLDALFSAHEKNILLSMLKQKTNTPLTTSMGRLFDAVSSLLGLCQQTSFEGEGAMALQFAAETSDAKSTYPFQIAEGKPLVIDWGPLILNILEEVLAKKSVAEMAKKFHNTLAAIVATVAMRAGLKKIMLTGGCFQNRLLTELCIKALKEKKLTPYWHSQIPPNDGGLAAGQALAAAQHQSKKEMKNVFSDSR